MVELLTLKLLTRQEHNTVLRPRYQTDQFLRPLLVKFRRPVLLSNQQFHGFLIFLLHLASQAWTVVNSVLLWGKVEVYLADVFYFFENVFLGSFGLQITRIREEGLQDKVIVFQTFFCQIDVNLDKGKTVERVFRPRAQTERQTLFFEVAEKRMLALVPNQMREVTARFTFILAMQVGKHNIYCQFVFIFDWQEAAKLP